MTNLEKKYKRICPSCFEDVYHKNELQLKRGIALKRKCLKCTRIEKGEKSRTKFTCPLCSETQNGEAALNEHGRSVHDKSPEEIYSLSTGISQPICACGCGEKLQLGSWKRGYAKFVLGHWKQSDQPEDVQAAIRKKRSESLKGIPNQMRGKTSPALQEAGRRLSILRKEKFASGELKAWNKGLTAQTNESLAKQADIAKENFKSGNRVSWAAGKTAETDERLRQKNLNLKERYQKGELKVWHAGKTAETDDRLLQKKLKGRNRDFTDKMRLPKDEIDSRISGLQNIKITCDIHTVYQNSQIKNIQVKCNTCNTESIENLAWIIKDKCRICHPYSSANQLAIEKFVQSLGMTTKLNDRSAIHPYELDVFVPDIKFAVEHDGLYYHSEEFIQDPDYHQKKTDSCKSVGIKLLHVFEDEWEEKREIIESIIRAKTGTIQKKINARDCIVKELTSLQRREFLNTNHLEGDTKAVIAYGLFKEDQLVSVISLRRAFHKKWQNHIEIARFANSLNTVVRGGLGKLLKAVKSWCRANNVASIMTYVDERFGDGHGYMSLGFTKTGTTIPRFWWTTGNKRFNRFKVRATATATERENAEFAGVQKIYGCSNLILVADVN